MSEDKMLNGVGHAISWVDHICVGFGSFHPFVMRALVKGNISRDPRQARNDRNMCYEAEKSKCWTARKRVCLHTLHKIKVS